MNTNQNTQAMRAYEALADDELILNLGSQSWATRHYSYMTLQARGQAMLDAALRGLRHTNPVIRRYAADLMDHLGNDVCVPPLLELLNDPVPKVRRQAVHSLSCQRCKATPLSADMTDILIDKMLNDPNQRVRGEAAFGLYMLPLPANPAVITAFERALAECLAHPVDSKPYHSYLRFLRRTLTRMKRTSESSPSSAAPMPLPRHSLPPVA